MVCSLVFTYLFITFFVGLYVETFVGLRSLIGTPSPALHIAKFFFGGWALRGQGLSFEMALRFLAFISVFFWWVNFVT